MRRKTKLWLAAAAILFGVGCMIFGGVMTVLGWDLTRLSTVRYETNEYVLTELYTDIAVDTVTADVLLFPAEGTETRVVCREAENVKHTVAVSDGRLTVTVKDTRRWYEHIGVSFEMPRVTVYLPQGAYGAVSVSAATGDLCVEALMADTLALSVTTGKVSVQDVACAGDASVHVTTGDVTVRNGRFGSLSSRGTTGDLMLQNTLAEKTLSVRRETGDVTLDGCDAAQILVQTTTGDIAGTLLSEKVFHAKTTTGRVSVPQSTAGGPCELSATTGDITVELR